MLSQQAACFKYSNNNNVPSQQTNTFATIDDLLGKIDGIERTLLIDRQNDTLLNTIEKIALIPDTKLVLVEPVQVKKVVEKGGVLGGGKPNTKQEKDMNV